jgi:hypothetical protein
MMYNLFFAFYLTYKKRKYERNYDRHMKEYDSCKKSVK